MTKIVVFKNTCCIYIYNVYTNTLIYISSSYLIQGFFYFVSSNNFIYKELCEIISTYWKWCNLLFKIKLLWIHHQHISIIIFTYPISNFEILHQIITYIDITGNPNYSDVSIRSFFFQLSIMEESNNIIQKKNAIVIYYHTVNEKENFSLS